MTHTQTTESDPESAAGVFGMEIATAAKHVVDELVEHDLIGSDLEPEDYAVACQIIAAAIADGKVKERSDIMLSRQAQ